MTAAVGTARRWARIRINRRALARCSEFWNALQRVGNALAEAEKVTKNAEDSRWWRERGQRHWAIATADEARAAVRKCRGSLRILSMAAKRFEPELIRKDWRRGT